MIRCVVLSSILVAACGDDLAGVTVAMHVTADAPAYGEVPFPSDVWRDGAHLGAIAGIDQIVGHRADLVSVHVAALDGFGLRPLVEMPLTGALDASSLPEQTSDRDAPAALVDVDPDSPEHGRVIAMDWRYDDARQVVAGSPHSGEVLREGTRYAAYVTTALRSAGGRAISRAPELAKLADAPERWQSTAEALGDLDEPKLAGLAVFTTQHATAPLVAARAAMDDRAIVPAPTLGFANPALIFSGQARLDALLGVATRATDGPRAGLERWGSDNKTGIAHDHVGVIGTGQTTVARFRGDTTGTNGPEDKTFHLDANGTPQLVSIDTIPITFILPATPPPADGYPVVIFGHGLGAGRDALETFAEPLTSQGYAVVGIDMFGHGSRHDPTDNGNNLAGRIKEFSGDPNLPDGFGDSTGLATQFDFFEGFLDVAAVRDSIRQSSLDLGRVVELVKTPDLDLTALAGPGTQTPKLDARRVTYLGESFGTVVGTLFAAIEPDIDLYVLDVPGGGVLDLILPSSAEIGATALPFIQTIYAPRTDLDRWNPMISLYQAVIDGGDPLSYAPHILGDRFTIGSRPLGPRSVVCIEVVGDQVLPNVGTDALARELGLAVMTPDLAPPSGMTEISSPASGNRDGQTAVLVQYAPATHGANWTSETGKLNYLPGFPVAGDTPFPKLPAPITITNPIYATFDQVFGILATHFAGDMPRVTSTLAPVADFDDDGVPDAQDAFPYDPAQH